jgi:outer membrane protein assembly factor BamB
VATAVLASIPLGSMADTTGFRGNGNGKYQGVNPPLTWGDVDNITWNTPLKFSNACPVVLGKKIFICEEPDILLALDMDTGKILWKASNSYADVNAEGELPKAHKVNGYTSPTPTTDGTNIYAFFSSGVLTGFTLDGKRLWGRTLPAQPHHLRWGNSASPRVIDGVLLVHYGNKLFALDAQSGKDKWVADSASGWGTPVATKIDDVAMVITPSGDFFDVQTGRKLISGAFKFAWNAPVREGNVIYKVDKNGAAAYSLDIDSKETLPCLWTATVPDDRYYATPVVHDGLIYNITREGILVVLDSKTGENIYEKDLELKGTFYPSPTLGGGRIYISNEKGITIIIEPGRTYKELARNKTAPFRSTPVFIGKAMFLRTNTGMCRVEE